MSNKRPSPFFHYCPVVLCVNLAACSDDDDDEPQTTSNLIGSVWIGTNPNTGFEVAVSIKNDSKCVVTVYRPNSTDLYDQEECTYLYSETTGVFSCEYDSYTITGKIEGNTMELTDKYGSYTLTKK